ncbi:sulfatase-like hydrolase/transferase [Algoriphagus sp. H41]|uniref:Sulfatase-like hydrolase/transferase n=1 Tax=Algoriphagus oliviformis TaxID=2811231 RepID=A0ABS3C0B4_9BACT|nr:sulfatase-like hydrolase/transferase [Algoriphagus oliviformis]MBN7810560.1 sulfatase-like hydrolase/transferase [Algoriphagus oliviformis]
MSLVFIVLMILLRVVETMLVFKTHTLDFSPWEVVSFSLFHDLGWILYFLGLLLILHVFVSLLSTKVARILLQLTFTLFILIHLGLVFYFLTTLVPLGKDLFAYSFADLERTVTASGQLNATSISIAILFALLVFGLLYLGIRVLNVGLKTLLLMTGAHLTILLVIAFWPEEKKQETNLTKQNIELNKSRFLAEETFDHLMYGGEFYFDFYLRAADDDLLVAKEYLNDEYPFLHTNNYPDVLSPFFDSLPEAPHLVFLFMESFGKAYSGKDAYLGSFTPFLDSLEQHSLVWTNALSSTGRTFGLLPGVFGGLPFGEKGFLELSPDFPPHNSLLSVLRENGYKNRFYLGSDANFDNEAPFLKYQGMEQIVEERMFPTTYQKAPSNSGFSWGYTDKDLFRYALETLPEEVSGPEVRIFQTLTSHDPYLVPERPVYEQKLRDHLHTTLGLSAEKVQEYMAYDDIYMTILYADDAVRLFFEEYKKRPEYENTIFVITGDHRLPEIPMSSRLDRFHVPLLIYSPRLKQGEYFKGVSSHYEITPSLLALLEKQNFVTLPKEVIWQGQVLDTARTFQSLIAMPLMRNKNQLMEYIHGEYFLSDGQVFVVSDGLNIDPVEDTPAFNRLNGEFEEFKNKNSYMVQTGKLLPPGN